MLTKQRFNEKLLIAAVSKLALFSNINSTLNIQKTQKSSHGLKPMKMFMQTLEKKKKKKPKPKESLSTCRVFSGLRETPIKNPWPLEQKAVSASPVNYKLMPEKARFLLSSLNRHCAIASLPQIKLVSKSNLCTALCFSISTDP